MAPMYIEHKIHIPNDQHNKLKRAIGGKTKQVSITISKESLLHPHDTGDHSLLLTPGQILKLQSARSNGTACTILMRRKQIDGNMKHEGGFLSLLAGLATKFLPMLLGSIATGAISGGIERAITSKKGNGFLLHKNQSWYKMSPSAKGRGLYLSPQPHFPGNYGNGLFIKSGSQISDGSGLLLGPNSPFKNIPLLNLLL